MSNHMHNIIDGDPSFTIDPITRNINPVNPDKYKVMQYDHDSERLTFEIPNTIEGHMMSDSDKVQIHYINVSSDRRTTYSDVYEASDLKLTGDTAKFSWLISQNATRLDGTLNFVVRFVCFDDEQNIVYDWHTEICNTIIVNKSISNNSSYNEVIPDLLEGWYNILEKMFKSPVKAIRINGKVSDMDESGTVDISIPVKVSDLDDAKEVLSKYVPVSRKIAEQNLESDITSENLFAALKIQEKLNQYALLENAGFSFSLDLDKTNYVMTIALKNKAGEILSSKQIDFPIESAMVDVDYDKNKKEFTFTLQNGSKVGPIVISEIVNGLVKDTLTIAGIDLKDDISSKELLNALGIGRVSKESDGLAPKTSSTPSNRNFLCEDGTWSTPPIILPTTPSDDVGAIWIQ